MCPWGWEKEPLPIMKNSCVKNINGLLQSVRCEDLPLRRKLALLEAQYLP